MIDAPAVRGALQVLGVRVPLEARVQIVAHRRCRARGCRPPAPASRKKSSLSNWSRVADRAAAGLHAVQRVAVPIDERLDERVEGIRPGSARGLGTVNWPILSRAVEVELRADREVRDHVSHVVGASLRRVLVVRVLEGRETPRVDDPRGVGRPDLLPRLAARARRGRRGRAEAWTPLSRRCDCRQLTFTRMELIGVYVSLPKPSLRVLL